MSEEWTTGYTRARLRTWEKLLEDYPEARNWEPDPSRNIYHASVDLQIQPFLGKSVPLEIRQIDLFQLLYCIPNTRHVVHPLWIDYFETGKLVHVPSRLEDDGFYHEVTTLTLASPAEDITEIGGLIVVLK